MILTSTQAATGKPPADPPAGYKLVGAQQDANAKIDKATLTGNYKCDDPDFTGSVDATLSGEDWVLTGCVVRNGSDPERVEPNLEKVGPNLEKGWTSTFEGWTSTF